jgi:nitrate/TMAO reductase-like tetraheme cytochrome c subunit
VRKITGWFWGLRRPVRWIVALATLVVLVVVAVTLSATTWEYTNSSAFCGTTCHTMPPEYTAYQISPHARVPCVDCHLGQDTILLTVPRKAKEVSHVVNALTQAYEPPIYVKNLRPARDTCEKCHNPDKFSSDTFVENKRYAQDEENDVTRTFLIVKTGGGTRREGLGRDIHWHIENEVWFYSDDPLKQTIPYVREIGPDGKMTEYFDAEAGLPPDFGRQVEGQLHRMDCIDCHTRISHLFRSPTDALDEALARQQIDSSIPYIKKKGVEVLEQQYESTGQGLQAVDALDDWYRENYPDYYAENQATVQQAVQIIKDIFTVTVFPNLGVGWQTHPDNSGHLEFPGCFRCHDGKHTSPEGQTVRLECNICHSIPEVVEGNMAAPVLSVERPGEPASHRDSNWLARHRYEFDATCATCHDVSNPGGTDNTSFCSNSACHGTQWKYVGLDAPAIKALVGPPPVPGSGEAHPVPHPIAARTDCRVCHALDGVIPFPDDHTSYEDNLCIDCHEPIMTVGNVELERIPAPPIPHTLEGRRDQCLVCHGADAFRPYPADHVGRSTSSCLSCHEQVTPVQVGAAPAEQPAAAGPAPIPHTLEGRDNCLVCHDLGGLKPFPADHAGRSTDTCTTCHQPAAPTGTEEASSATEESAEETEAAAAPEIPHALEGRQDCVACHGLDGIQPFPADHAGRTSDTCQACHKPAVAPQAEETSTPGPQATEEPTTGSQAEATSTPEPQATEEPAAEGPPAIPHALEGRGDCVACHGPDGIQPFPADHAGRTSDTCQACHKPAPASQGEATPTPEPRASAEPTATLRGEATSAPEAQVTAEPTDEGPPPIPHSLEGREDCLVCHGLDGIKPFPADHARRTPVMCPACHELQGEEEN